MKDSKSFDKKYANCLPQIKTIDFSRKAEMLGIQKQDQLFVFNFFNRQIAFDGNDFIDIQGDEVTTAIKVVFCAYLMMCPDRVLKASNRLVTFREFANAGPLFSRFTENTGKIICTTFSGQMEKLKSQCQNLGGTLMETESYDLSVRFQALCRVPVILNFNDTDELMPANAGFLYHDDAETYLDLECLTTICTYLTGLLIQAG
jgi:hypothetical protein